MLSNSRRAALLVIALLLFVPAAWLQIRIDPQRPQYMITNGGTTTRAARELPVEFALGALTGFKEAVAGLLWVRADDFFDQGDYDAIPPLIRIITWLDPHNIDVYETGAWHMDYNFTDVDQRSDRRYIPLSLALLDEGIENNPNEPEMYADLGFTHYYRKIEDYPKAAETFAQGQTVVQRILQEAANKPGDANLQEQAVTARKAITTLGHGLAHALEAEGKIPEALAQWRYCIAQHRANLKFDKGDTYGDTAGLNISQKQYFEMIQRAKWRPRDTKPPLDMKLTAQLVRVAPKVFVMKGTLQAIGAKTFNLQTGQVQWAPIDGCRVEIRLQDEGYKMPVLPSFTLSSLKLNPETTIMQEAASVRNGKYERKLDMSQDPSMYSFTAPRYTVTFWFNPANPVDCPPNVQDRIGWRGEGMTDRHYLDTSGQVPGDTSAPIPGLRMLKKTITLTRDDILGKTSKTIFE